MGEGGVGSTGFQLWEESITHQDERCSIGNMVNGTVTVLCSDRGEHNIMYILVELLV